MSDREPRFEASSERITDLFVGEQPTGVQFVEITETMFDVLCPWAVHPGSWLWSTENSRANAESAALAAAGITDPREP